MKHNQILPNNHFNKNSMLHKTWFNQEIAAKKRGQLRKQKAKLIYPRPTEKLYPVVRCCSIRYNNKKRYGRGFTLGEISGAGLTLKYAVSIGIAIDKRRKDKSEEVLNANIERIKEYQNRLTFYNTIEEVKAANPIQHKGPVMPVEKLECPISSIHPSEISKQKA